jgi:hypothetical protein
LREETSAEIRKEAQTSKRPFPSLRNLANSRPFNGAQALNLTDVRGLSGVQSVPVGSFRNQSAR